MFPHIEIEVVLMAMLPQAFLYIWPWHGGCHVPDRWSVGDQQFCLPSLPPIALEHPSLHGEDSGPFSRPSGAASWGMQLEKFASPLYSVAKLGEQVPLVGDSLGRSANPCCPSPVYTHNSLGVHGELLGSFLFPALRQLYLAFEATGVANNMHGASSAEEAWCPGLLEVCFTTYEKQVNLPLISVHS